MPVIRIRCPKCAATATGNAAHPLPAGKMIRCARCGTTFRIPARPALPQTLRPVSHPKPAGGRPTFLRAAPVRPAPRRVVYRVTCPACRVLLKSPTPPPTGKPIVCPKCRKPFVARPRQTRLAAPPRSTKLSAGPPAKPKGTRLGPQRPKETKLGASPPTDKGNGRPVRVLKCATCAAVMRITGTLPPGKAFPCPRCRRPVSLAPRAKKTTLGKQAKQTTLAPKVGSRQSVVKRRKTEVRGRQAKPTTLAPARGEARPAVLPQGTLIRCPHCATAFKGPQAIPVGRLLKCSKCSRTFRAAPAPTPGAVPQPRRKPGHRPAPRRKRHHLGLYCLMALAAVAIAVIALGFFDVIPLFPRHDIPDSAWREFVPPAAHCRIAMPGSPEEVHAQAHGPGGGAARKFVVVRKREDAAFFLAVSDRLASARASLEAVYQAERDAVASVARGRLARERDVRLAGRPAKEFQIEFPDGALLIGRVCLVQAPGGDGRAYVLVATGADLEPDSGACARFFDSFHVD